MGKIINYFKKIGLSISLALYNTEKLILSQQGKDVYGDINHIQSIKQGRLSDSLRKGELTEEVKLLRHRMYKILDESSKLKVKFKKDSEGNLTYELSEKSVGSSKVKGDPFDDYKVELVIDNSDIGGGMDLTSEHPDETIVDKQIICTRLDLHPRFEIEKYCTKLFVRYIEDDVRLLEFYIPKYVSQYTKTRFLISELKKLMEAPKYSDILDIRTVNFITFNAIGAQDFREFVYDIIKFDKIVEHEGSYIIKFKANVTTNGDNTIDKYRHEEQDKRYEAKAPRKQ